MMKLRNKIDKNIRSMYGGKEKRTESLSVCQKVRRMPVSGNSLSRTAEEKHNQVQSLLKRFGTVKPVIGMKDPYFTGIRFMLYLTGTGREILFPEFMSRIHIEWFPLTSV